MLIFSGILSSSTLLTAQSKIWLHGNKIIDLSDSYNIGISNLPTPSGTAGLVYNGAIPQLSEHIEYDSNGNILFFMVDGKIYNKDGYLMVQNSSISNGIYADYPEKMITYSIVKVPNQCDKFYVISNYCNYTTNIDIVQTPHFFISLLDLSLTNVFYPNDPDKRGALVNWSSPPTNYPIDLTSITNYDQAPNGYIHISKAMILIDITNYAGNQNVSIPLVQFVVFQNNQNEFYLNTSQYLTSFDWKLDAAGLSLVGQNTCNDGVNDYIYYYETRVAAKTTLQELKLANGYRANQNIAVSSYPQNSSISSCSSLIPAILTAYEISEDGSTIVFLSLGNLKYVSTSNSQSSGNSFPNIVSITNLSAWNKGCFFRRNLYEGQESIYVFHQGGVDIIKGIDNPQTASYIPNFITSSIPLMSNQALTFALDLEEGLTHFNSVCGISTAENLIVAPVQVYNRIDEIVSSSACCVFETNYNAEGNIVVNSNQTWSPGNNPFNNSQGPIHFSGSITIQSGKHLQINQGLEIRFDEVASVQVSAGAKLTINNAKLTSYSCDGKMWPGIDVYGPGNLTNIAQSVVIGGTSGIVEMQNNAIIENARIAIEVGKSNYNAGGVVRVLSGKFVNNETGVKFYKYSYQNNSAIQPNKSFIQVATFETNAPLANPSLWPKSHIDLNGIIKLQIRNCNFRNTTPITSDTEWAKRGTGIRSFNSSFGCSGVLASDHSFFHLTNGIVQFNLTSPINSFVCTGMHFNGCMAGILNLASNNIEVYSNKFSIDQITAVDMPESVETGIYCSASTGYSIEQNDFNGIDTSLDGSEYPSGIGIRIVSSGPADNVIRNNDFESLLIGIHAQKENMNVGAVQQTGLQLLCNDFAVDKIDIYRDEQSTIRQDQGGNQPGGNEPIPAYNIFSEATPNCSTHSDFLVSPNNLDYTNYFHNGQEIQIPNCVTNNGTFDMLSNALVPDVTGVCSYTYNSNPHLNGSPGLVAQHRVQLESLQTELNTKLLLYEQVVDKNQKVSSLTAIETAYPNESEFVKNLLLQRYPLSDDVLKKLILHASKFESWHLTEVFVANSPLDKKVLAEIEQSEILSPFFMQFIYSANENPGGTLKKIMEMDMLNKASQIDKLSFEYIKHIQNEYDFSVDSSLYEVPFTELYAECLMSSAKDQLKLQATLKMFEGLNAETEFEILNIPSESVSMKLISLKAELDSADITALEGYTAHLNEEVASEAIQFLDFLNFSLSTPPVQLPLQYRSLSAANDSGKERKKLSLLGATPNPSNEYCYIHYPIEADNHANISIIDIQGREVQNLALNNNGLLNLNTQNLEKGIYLCRLMSGNMVLDTIKITIIH